MINILDNKINKYATDLNKTINDLSILVSFSSGIDSTVLSSLMVDLKENYKQSFIIATHDQSILDIADRVVYLKDGIIKKEM